MLPRPFLRFDLAVRVRQLRPLDVGDGLAATRVGERELDPVAGVQDVQQIALDLGLELFGRTVCFGAASVGADGAALCWSPGATGLRSSRRSGQFA